MRFTLPLSLLALAGSLHAQAKPWIEVGLGSARDRTPCPTCGGPGGATRVAFRAAVGAVVSPSVGWGLSLDHALHPDIIDGEGVYTVMSAFAEVGPRRTPAIRGRAGLGRAFASTAADEQGQGFAFRLGGGLGVPPAKAAGIVLSADYFHAFSGRFRRVSSFNPAVPQYSRFDFRAIQVAVSFRVGGRYSPPP